MSLLLKFADSDFTSIQESWLDLIDITALEEFGQYDS